MIAYNMWLSDNFWQEFKKNILVGIIIAIILQFTHNFEYISQLENFAVDKMMFFQRDTKRMMHKPKQSEASVKFAFVNIDEDTYRSWKEPFYIPRNKLLKLIKVSINSGARAIIVDVDFSNPSRSDEGLLKFLSSYNKELPLFVIRSFYPKSKLTNYNDFIIRPSILDTIPANKHIHWVLALYKSSVYDQRVRYWSILKLGCLNNNVVVVPSIQLMIDAYLTLRKTGNSLMYLKDELTELSPNKCSEIESNIKKQNNYLVYGKTRNRNIKLYRDINEKLRERIIYTISESNKNELYIVPAHKLTNAFKDSKLKNKIVIIGSSFADSKDIHETPLGEMTGSMIIINAIKSLYVFGQVKSPPIILKALVGLGLIIIMGLIFTFFSSHLTTKISGLCISLILVPISFYYFKYGIWVDLAGPILGMQIHQWWKISSQN